MRTLLPLLAAAVLTATLVQPAAAADNPTWSPALSSGSGVGVAVQGGAARIDQRTAFRAPREDAAAEGTPDTAVATGLLTLDPHRLDSPTNRIAARVAARLTEGATATVDVRGLRASGNWSEWIPADDGTAVLPEPVIDVQARLVLTGDPGPEATGLTLTALASVQVEGARAEADPLSYKIFATREGLVGGTTANGHVITPHDRFVALPSRRALSPNGSSDYSVRICAPNGRCAFAPVWDVGPWNIKDDYWNAGRQQWRDLPQGTPQAQAAFRNGYNGGKDGFDRKIVNPAGIDLADGTFYNVGLNNNGWVTVTYLWTGGGGSGPSVTGMSQCATSSNADCYSAAAGNGSDCHTGHFCIYTGTNYSGTVFSFYHCKYNGGDWALQNWLSAGSYINDNSGGTDAYTKDANHNVITATTPGSRSTNYNFDPVYYVQAC